MTKQDKKGLIVLISIAVVIIACVIGTILMQTKSDKYKSSSSIEEVEISDDYKKNTDKDVIVKQKKDSRGSFIAAVYLEGAIEEKNSTYNQKWILDTIHSLKNNKKNVAIALYIDSPGGSVYHADEVYLALQDYKTSGKPVYVYQGPMAASGGYYISCAADKIYANRNTLTGCIGVIFGSSFDVTGLLDKLGIKSKTFHSGRNKTMLHPDVPLTSEQESIMQELCDECYNQFVSIVANNRNMSYEYAAELSDGRLYSARQALDNGLVDCIDSWEGMLQTLSEDELGLPGIKVATFKKEKEKNLLNIVTSAVTKLQNQQAAVNANIPLSVLNNQLLEFNSYPAYLYTGM